MYTLRPHLFLFLALLALPLVGCDSSDDDVDVVGGNSEGRITITGDLSSSFSGNAYAVYDEDDHFEGVVIFDGAYNQFNTVTSEYVVIAWDGDSDVSERTYPIDDTGGSTTFAGGYFDYNDSSNFVLVGAEDGSIEFTSVGGDEVRGSFSFSGQVFTGLQEAGTANASGSFRATVIRADDFPDDA